jgi:hypothetical protein
MPKIVITADKGLNQSVGTGTMHGQRHTVTEVTADTTLVVNDSGKVFVFNDAAATFTLPAATGSGVYFKFIVGSDATGNKIVKVANATDVMEGTATVLQDGADTAVHFESAAASDTITFDESTTGGQVGDFIDCIDYASGKWWVHVKATGTGTEASPFSATVS